MTTCTLWVTAKGTDVMQQFQHLVAATDILLMKEQIIQTPEYY